MHSCSASNPQHKLIPRPLASQQLHELQIRSASSSDLLGFPLHALPMPPSLPRPHLITNNRLVECVLAKSPGWVGNAAFPHVPNFSRPIKTLTQLR
jgi:hypothetical protein